MVVGLLTDQSQLFKFFGRIRVYIDLPQNIFSAFLEKHSEKTSQEF